MESSAPFWCAGWPLSPHRAGRRSRSPHRRYGCPSSPEAPAAFTSRWAAGWRSSSPSTSPILRPLPKSRPRRSIGAKRADIAFTLADTAYDAFTGQATFQGTPIPIRTLTPLYNNFNHLVTIEGTGVATVADLRGKRVSVGSPGSGTEVTAVRILRAAGLDPDRDIRKERLGVQESVDAIKDRKIDAFFWSGGLPTSAVLDLATTPGLRIRLVPLDTTIAELQKTYGNLYFKAVILKEIYPGAAANAATVGVANLLVVHQDFNGDLAYQITKLIYERRSELAQVHKEAANITLTGVVGRSPVPFHPGAIRYFKEKGVQGF